MNKPALLTLAFLALSAAAGAQVAALPPTPTGITPPRPTARTGQMLIQEPATPQLLNPFYRTADCKNKNLLWTVPPNHVTADFGFFCRQELKLDRALPMITRFRLGSQQQADELDGKR